MSDATPRPDRANAEIVLEDLRKDLVALRSHAEELSRQLENQREQVRRAYAEAYDLEITIERLEKVLRDD